LRSIANGNTTQQGNGKTQQGNGLMHERSHMDPRAPCASDGSRELEELQARLREVGGGVLAQGQTPCCYALSSNHPLLWPLRKILTAMPQGRLPGRSVPAPARLTAEEITP
jgi:hypothetical protein